jgi:hypothetical protein
MTLTPPTATVEPMSEAEALLAKLQPVVRFDSHEAFFAHDVRAMADNGNFQLTRDESHVRDPGYVIATHAQGLDIEFLGADAYLNKAPCEKGDHFGLDRRATATAINKVADYRDMERRIDPVLRNFVYGRAVGRDGRSVSSTDGDVWLHYWYFYIYNDANFGSRVDLHEGDWEMVQFLTRDGEPISAVYAQHAYAEQRNYSEVGIDDQLGCPIIYSARGSHASYFEAGLHQTHAKIAGEYLPLWWDAADGNGPHIRQTLRILADAQLPGCAMWKGCWGGTRARIPLIDGESPAGPIAHAQWSNPDSLAADPVAHDRREPDTAPPVIVRRSPPGLAVRFDFTNLADRPDRLVMTVTGEGEPPRTQTIAIGSIARGRVVTRMPLDAGRSYTVEVSTIDSKGIPTQPSARGAIKVGKVPPLSPSAMVAAVLRQIDRFWLWLGTRLARRVPRDQTVIQGQTIPAARAPADPQKGET